MIFMFSSRVANQIKQTPEICREFWSKIYLQKYPFDLQWENYLYALTDLKSK